MGFRVSSDKDVKIITFRLTSGIYIAKEYLDKSAWALSGFLSDDVGWISAWALSGFLSDDVGWISACRFRHFVEGSMRKETSSNFSWLEKEGENIIIGCQFFNDSYEYHIKMPQNELILILNQWDKLIKKQPQEIIFFKGGESYRLEGHGFLDKQ